MNLPPSAGAPFGSDHWAWARRILGGSEHLRGAVDEAWSLLGEHLRRRGPTRATADSWQEALAPLGNLPQVLVHQDICENQFLVYESTLRIVGLLDWQRRPATRSRTSTSVSGASIVRVGIFVRAFARDFVERLPRTAESDSARLDQRPPVLLALRSVAALVDEGFRPIYDRMAKRRLNGFVDQSPGCLQPALEAETRVRIKSAEASSALVAPSQT
jgi:hypothetical protein